MAGVATLTDAARVRALNDAFRQSLNGGRVVVTVGVAALPETTRAAVLSAVRAFDRFDATDDPHGEHDFGEVAAAGMRCFWKIDCYGSGPQLRLIQSGRPDGYDPRSHGHAGRGVLKWSLHRSSTPLRLGFGLRPARNGCGGSVAAS